MVSIMKPAVITFIICLLALHVEARYDRLKKKFQKKIFQKKDRGDPVRTNCNHDCSGQALDSLHPPFNYGESSPSPSCPHREFTYIVSSPTTNGNRCVKPGSILATFLSIGKGEHVCNCEDQGLDSMSLSLIKDEEVYEASLSCPAREIIVTTSNGQPMECVNPESDLGKALYQFKTKGTPICKCSGQGINSMHPRLFKNDQIYEASRFCPRKEFTVTTTDGTKLCVNPESNLGKFIILKRAGELGNCTCPAQVIDSMHPSLIKNYTIYEVTQFCPGREIVVTTTDGKKPCVNPESNLGKFIYDIRRTGQRDSCKCPDQGTNNMNSSLIKDYQIHEASPSCPSREIVVTTTDGKEECVNPESVVGQNLHELNIQKTAGHGVGVGVGVTVLVIVLILICGVCWKKNCG